MARRYRDGKWLPLAELVLEDIGDTGAVEAKHLEPVVLTIHAGGQVRTSSGMCSRW